ncbi:hypothetical protein N2152v2_000296 [Parachlorella kessleri]
MFSGRKSSLLATRLQERRSASPPTAAWNGQQQQEHGSPLSSETTPTPTSSGTQLAKLGLLRPLESLATSQGDANTDAGEGKCRAQQIADQLEEERERHRRPWFMVDPEGPLRHAWDLVAYALIWVLIIFVPLRIAFIDQERQCHYLRFTPSEEVPGDEGAHAPTAFGTILMSCINIFFIVSRQANLFLNFLTGGAPGAMVGGNTRTQHGNQIPPPLQADLFLNFLTTADLFLNFLTGVPATPVAAAGGEVMPDYHFRHVAVHYVRTWFLVDFSACFPLNCVLTWAHPEDNFYNLGNLIWLLRVLGLRRRFGGLLEWVNTQLDVRREISTGLRRILKFAAVVLVVNHYYACLLWLVIRVEHFPAGTWPDQLHIVDAPMGEQWLFAYFTLISSMIGLSYGSYPPITWPEALVWVFAMITVAAMFAVLNGLILSFILSATARRQQYQELLDAAVRLVDTQRVPRSLQNEILGFLKAKFEDEEASGAWRGDRLLRELPRRIRSQLSVLKTGHLLSKLPLFRDNHDMLQETAPLLQRSIALPGQVLVQAEHAQHSALFLARGLVDVTTTSGELVDTAGPGDVLGETALLPVPPGAAEGPGQQFVAGSTFKSLVTAEALTRCQLYTLRWADFRAVLEDYPEVAAEVQLQAARYLEGCLQLTRREPGGGAALGDAQSAPSMHASVRLGHISQIPAAGADPRAMPRGVLPPPGDAQGLGSAGGRPGRAGDP